MTTATHARATLDDLLAYEGKAELIGGRIVPQMPAGRLHNRTAFNVAVALRAYAARRGVGEAFTDNMGYGLPTKLPSGRESFAPDASYHDGPFPPDEWTIIRGGPTFAVEVRSTDDYGPAAEAAMAFERAEYFAAGTRAVWDVDPDAQVVHLYRVADPANPVTFGRGDTAHAEPAVPGWTMPVDDVFA